MIGIYAIHCLINDRKYIGGSSDIENRWTVHKSVLRLNTHHCAELQKAFLLYGEENFVYSVLEQVIKKSNLKKREQYWLDRHLDSFNTKKRADGKGSLNLTEEQKIHWSEKAKNRCTPEWKEEVSARVKKQHVDGKFGSSTWTEESRKKQSENIKISINTFYETERGKELAKESSVRMAATQKELWKSEEYRIRMKEVLKNNGKCQKPKIWITDGVKNLNVPPEETIPKGWRRGMTKHYKEKQSGNFCQEC